MAAKTFTPHGYQHQIIGHIQALPRCAVWAGMGTGKTVSTLTALDGLSLVEDVYPALVLAPLRVARATWPNEVKKWTHLSHLRVSVITGDEASRNRALQVPADIYTTNYEQLPWLVERLKKDWPFKTVVADEFTRLKSFRLRQGSKRARALGAVAHTKVDRFIGLTGTPSPNGLTDLWGQTWFLDEGHRLGRTFSAFESRWFRTGFNGYGSFPLDHAQKDIEQRLADLCVTVKGLPVEEPIRNRVMVELPTKARRLYKDMERDMFAQIGESGVEAGNAAGKTSKCHQLANGAIYVEDSTDWEEVHRAKIEALESIVEEAAGAPVLVAYHFKHDLVRLLKAFPQGRVLDADPQTIDDWNAGKIPVLFAHPQSAGHGLNMAEGGNILAFFSVNWSLEEHEQIIERVGPQRQAQAGLKRPVFLHYLLAEGTVDELIMQRLETKASVQEVLLAAMERRC
ncbi:DNA helicase [Caulobacter phage KcrB]|nr:DNA helicase [Caulobacter phage RW]WCA46363.1 DNA helicase [Caulobacter phage KcrB]WCD56298.1 DNA helicase [Caulobacter phage RLK]WNV48090.1 DNA helicase [Caulobacter phage GB2A]